jgi:putative transcriptional regulator
MNDNEDRMPDPSALDYAALLDESLAEMEAIAQGHGPTHVHEVDLTTTREATAPQPPNVTGTDVVQLRESFQVSQALFARILNVSVSLVRAWERGARIPEGPALRLLEMAKEAPAYFVAKVTPLRATAVQPPYLTIKTAYMTMHYDSQLSAIGTDVGNSMQDLDYTPMRNVHAASCALWHLPVSPGCTWEHPSHEDRLAKYRSSMTGQRPAKSRTA